VTTAPGMPDAVPALATKAGISTTKAKITTLYASIDVSDQPPFEAMARLEQAARTVEADLQRPAAE
jgi:hypothetical protein